MACTIPSFSFGTGAPVGSYIIHIHPTQVQVHIIHQQKRVSQYLFIIEKNYSKNSILSLKLSLVCSILSLKLSKD